MKLDWSDFISLFTFIQLLFLMVVILNYKKGKRLSNLLLAGFMASNAFLFAHLLLTRFGWTSPEQWIVLYCTGGSMYLLLMPFLYLYIQSLCYNNFRLRINHLMHAFPFVFFVVIMLVQNYLHHYDLQLKSVWNLKEQIDSVKNWGYHIVLHLQIISYIIASIVVLVRYRRTLRDLYSSIEKIDLSWCNLLLIAFATMWFLDFLNWILGISHLSSPTSSYWIYIASIFINLVFTLIVTYKGLAQSAIFLGIQGTPKYAASRLEPSECDAIIRKLTALIETEKPYLSPSLSIEELSKKLNISVKNLSQAIHTGLNQNFYDFINTCRIEEIKKRIHDEQHKNFTLLAIALDSGFNSKSVFNAAFKKHTDMTPKEYKRLQVS
jgi:AraC-like DNA-binding protein